MAKDKKTAFVVVQQGGATSEVYVHAFDTKGEANTYRKSCDRATYNTTEVLSVPNKIVETCDDVEALEAVVKAAVQLVLS